MVVEEILSPQNVRKHSINMTFFAFILGSLALWSSYILFPAHISILVIAFITIGTVPLIHKIFIDAEYIQERIKNKTVIHKELVKTYAFFFVGLIICFTFWYLVLPAHETDVCLFEGYCFNGVSQDAFFSEQTRTLDAIGKLRTHLTGNVVASIGACGANTFCWFEVIFFNNFEILLLAVIFSFLYGAGAVFLIAWNASIIGVMIGQNILESGPLRFFGLLPHGIPELVAYFSAAIAGGLLSVAVVKRKIQKYAFKQIMEEVMVFVLLGLVSLFVGAVIEACTITGSGLIVIVLSTAYLLGLIGFMVFVGRSERVEEISVRKARKVMQGRREN